MFEFRKTNHGGSNVPVIKEYPTSASVVYPLGAAVAFSSGALVLATGTTKPIGITMKAYTAPASGMLNIPIMLLDQTQEYKTTFAADASANTEGTMVTLHTDALQVTATATSGVFRILKKLGTGASGTSVIGRFE